MFTQKRAMYPQKRPATTHKWAFIHSTRGLHKCIIKKEQYTLNRDLQTPKKNCIHSKEALQHSKRELQKCILKKETLTLWDELWGGYD